VLILLKYTMVSKFNKINLPQLWLMSVCPLPPWATAVAGATYSDLSRGPVRVSLFLKISLLFCINSDGDKLYTKLVAFDGICNFVVQIFFI
jgi:hypothetical protein